MPTPAPPLRPPARSLVVDCRHPRYRLDGKLHQLLAATGRYLKTLQQQLVSQRVDVHQLVALDRELLRHRNEIYSATRRRPVEACWGWPAPRGTRLGHVRSLGLPPAHPLALPPARQAFYGNMDNTSRIISQLETRDICAWNIKDGAAKAVRLKDQRVDMFVLCSSCLPPTCDALAVLMAHADLHGDRPSSMLNLLRHQLSDQIKFRFIGAHGAAGDCEEVVLRDAVSPLWPCLYSDHVRGSE